MSPKLHKTLRGLKQVLVLIVVLALTVIVASLALVAWHEYSRSRQLELLVQTTQIPEWLFHPGVQPLGSAFLPLEERICVLHPYSGNLGIADMTTSESEAIRGLNLPSEDMSWYLVAYQGQAITRALLIDEMVAAKLISPSLCFGRHDVGTIRVQMHSPTSPPLREVYFFRGVNE